jgi:nucleotide-binding universal stress UspA family protein
MRPQVLRVFHPTDFTQASEQAFAHALRIASCGEARLSLLHVGAPDDELRWDQFPSPKDMLQRWDILPDKTEDDDAGVDVVRVEARGENVVRCIAHFLETAPADLIVLSTHGRRGFDAWFSGSVAEPVARLSHAMTLFVTHGCESFVSAETGQVTLDHILMPVVVDPSCQHARRAAQSLAAALGIQDARIIACYIGEPADAPLVGDVPLLIRQGNAADEIVALARELDVNMIAMTTEGRHGVLDALRGSTTERVVRRAPCPVLAVPTNG